MLLDDQEGLDVSFKAHNATRQAAWQARQNQDDRRYKEALKKRLQTDYATREIIAVDGEGVTCGSGHNYVLLAASDGRSIACPKERSLGTKECLDFLITYSGKLVVGFALTYDINLMLKDLSPGLLLRLHRKRSVIYRPTPTDTYRLSVTPRKCATFSILRTATLADRIKGQEPGPLVKRKRLRYVTVKSVTVWDTFGFFQSSFVEALKQWKIGTQEEIEYLTSMKAQRAQFIDVEAEEVGRYNDLECRLLVELVTRLRATLLGAGIKLKRWDGAGAVASALLAKHDVKRHIESEHPAEVMNAYFGGRIQVCQLGQIPGPIYNYDINSAYPGVCRTLPSLRGRWQHLTAYVPDERWSFYRCRWRLASARNGISRFAADASPILTPFPVRNTNKNIHYPLQGEGWYWAPLVKVALVNWEGIDVLEGWAFEPGNADKPFGFIDEYYAQRVAFKRLGDPRHIVIKLGLNSLYGKTAQGLSWRGVPPFRSYVWAGFITASTQATLLEAALQKAADVVCFATDGLYLRAPLHVRLSSDIGGWEETVYDGMTIVQPGLYQLQRGEKNVLRTRGYHDYEIDWKQIRELWTKGGCHEVYQTTVNRFLSLGVALQTKRLKEWGTWVDDTRVLHLRPATGVPGNPVARHAIRWLPDLKVEGLEMSQPYTPKASPYEVAQNLAQSLDQEQPEPLT